MDRLAADRMFIAVMETGSFAAAARRQGTSAGQASKLVSALESELGTRLLNRTTRALAPTELGQSYFAQIRNIIGDLDALDLSLHEAGEAPRGKLRLSAPISLGTMELARALNGFAAAYPGIELDVAFSDRFVNLVDEGFDAAIRVGNPVDSSLVARKLGEVRIVVVAAPEYLAKHGGPQTPAELSGHDCILDTNLREPAHWRFTETVVVVTGRLRYSNARACLMAAEDGLGIARIPHFAARDALAEGRVVPLLERFEPPPGGIYALYPAGRHLPRKVRLLIDYLAKDLEATG
ncbi:LysR family transcriptional regulator [Pararhodobacter sp. CCB-MM2]|uniref:LysR family transcriptional regulator n=1 Tax=Pararhodobacter sp. CCB-MM2 TaxID=1786003 RepID=UPI00083235DF|nr:LysR family transcriptional regulator [Pararhodobacter sp. CCB-MM2]MCA2012546.1 LysR family transcriptional regulator [Cereibacter sphaeroides]